jgi:Tfp pilus assembly protein PilO
MKPIYKKCFMAIAIWMACFVVFFFAYMLLLAPQGKSKMQVEEQLAEKKRIYGSAVKAAQEESKLKLDEEIKQLQNRLRAFVVDSEDLANLVFDVGRIAGEKDVTSFRIKTQENRQGSGSEIPNCSHICENQIKIGFNAGFNQFAAFLNALERHQPIVFVDEFAVTRSEQDDSGHQVNMNLAVFVRKRQDS